MTKEHLRDKTLDWMDDIFNGKLLDRSCWAVMILAALYFAAGFVMSDLVSDLFVALAR